MYPYVTWPQSFCAGRTSGDRTDAAPGSRMAGSAGDGVSPELVARLLDARYRFPHHDQRTLCEWLATALPACPSWPSGAALVWQDGADPAVSRSSRRSLAAGQAVLWVGPHLAPCADGQWGLGLAGLWSTMDPVDPSRTHSLLPVCWTAPPGDIFDALALALTQRAASLAGATSTPREWTGMRLRQELADWLRTPAGRRSEGPKFATGYRLAGDHRAGEGTSISISVNFSDGSGNGNGNGNGDGRRPARDVGRPVDIPAAALAPLAHGDDAADVTDVVDVAGAAEAADAADAVDAVRHASPAASLDEILQTLREGGWCEALDHLIPTVLVRLPRGHPLRLSCLQVDHAGTVTAYGWASSQLRVATLVRQSDQSMTRSSGRSPEVLYPPGPDSFLQAVLGVSSQRPGMFDFSRVRNTLAAIMACNRTLMQLCLTLFERGFPGDQAILLRMCLFNRQLTLAGQQLLDPSRPQRRVTREDLERWFERHRSAFLRSPDTLAAEGISVLDAQRLASPLFPTLAGETLLGRPMRRHREHPQPDALALLKQQLPELIYAYGSREVLHQQIGVGASTLRQWATPAAIRQAKQVVEQAVNEETVEMPPDRQPSLFPLPMASVVEVGRLADVC